MFFFFCACVVVLNVHPQGLVLLCSLCQCMFKRKCLLKPIAAFQLSKMVWFFYSLFSYSFFIWVFVCPLFSYLLFLCLFVCVMCYCILLMWIMHLMCVLIVSYLYLFTLYYLISRSVPLKISLHLLPMMDIVQMQLWLLNARLSELVIAP